MTWTGELPSRSTSTSATEWVECYDDNGTKYYYSQVTGQTQWEAPSTLALAVNKSSSDSTASSWVECQDEQGNTYYYDSLTGNTSWEAPSSTTESNSNKESALVAATTTTSSSSSSSNWVECYDEQGNKYYYDTITGASSWDPPTATSTSTSTDKRTSTASSSSSSSTSSDSGSQEQAALVPLGSSDLSSTSTSATAASWVECYDDQGNAYYYNAITGATQWDRPEGMVVTPSVSTSTVSSSVSFGDGQVIVATEQEWTPLADEQGNTYYYNAQTGETRWDDPYATTGTTALSLLENASSVAVPSSSSLSSSSIIPLSQDLSMVAVPSQEDEEFALGLEPSFTYVSAAGVEMPITSLGEWEAASDEEGRTYYVNRR